MIGRSEILAEIRNKMHIWSLAQNQMDKPRGAMFRCLDKFEKLQDADAHIIRLEEDKDIGIIGVLMKDQRIVCYTLENYEKAIPGNALYQCKRVVSPNFGNTFEIDVPDRTLIRFHWGNFQEDTEGCPLLGTYVGDIWNKKEKGMQRGVGRSRDAFEKFQDAFRGVDEFELAIIEI